MADAPDAGVRISAFPALACARCKSDTCAPGADRVLAPAPQHLASYPDPYVRSVAAELVGKFPHTGSFTASPAQGRPVRNLNTMPSRT